jgi:hypothetical protein
MKNNSGSHLQTAQFLLSFSFITTSTTSYMFAHLTELAMV